jgi:adenosylhomocysteinase
VKAVIAIPYSVNEDACREISKRYNVIKPSLDLLSDPDFLLGVVRPSDPEERMAICEVGGYFAGVASLIHKKYPNNFVGVVEDTEAGHRRYVKEEPLSVPVVSVARSPLKRAEDSLVGASCVFSVERVLRQSGFVLEPRQITVIGYGRVGSGVAHTLQRRQCATHVFDSDPVRRTHALGDGFSSPIRERALTSANIIFGASGQTSLHAEDFSILQDGVILASCSSRDVEFDVQHLEREYQVRAIGDGIKSYTRNGQTLYLLNDGLPVNFRDGAVIGPPITLTHGELIVSLAAIFAQSLAPGVQELSDEDRAKLAAAWIDTFYNGDTGYLKLRKESAQ